MRLLFIAITSIALFSCGNASAPKVIPGAGGSQVYELMEEDSTEQLTDTTAKTK